jgi:cellulose synthase/poly-beta-1,6-N-acetylglucosamine synthase-like glycosyltransferase
LAIRFLYYAIILWLGAYGLLSLIWIGLYLRHSNEHPQRASAQMDEWPTVVVQLPVYNERHVVDRLIEAAASLDYPRERLEVQVLDDSTDDTTRIVREQASRFRNQGTNVQVLHRPRREGFKAGALAYGLARTQAEFVAIFDADFRPESGFLREVMPYFVARPELGVVQARWGHLNDIYSLLTRAQALLLDGQFVVEQTARNRSGLLMCFNGSGGVWRRQAIVDGGGWQSDTMNEDMDLSYRAQVAGWQVLYLPDLEAPGELPPQMEAYKQQQARWACGSMQCLRKLSGLVIHSDLTLPQKIASILHMGGYLTQPLIIALLLMSLPIVCQARPMPGILALLGLVGLGQPLLWVLAQSRLHRDWARRILYLPVLALVGVGITASTTRAVFQGLTQWGGTFKRTPKFKIEGRQGHWSTSLYRLMPDRVVVAELLLSLYAAGTCVVAWCRGNYGSLPFLLLYVLGFGSVACLGLLQRPYGKRKAA